MAQRKTRIGNRAARWLSASFLLCCVVVLGCDASTEDGPRENTRSAPTTPLAGKRSSTQSVRQVSDRLLHQSFEDATVSEPPDDQVLPDKTLSGKSVGKLYTQVKALWSRIVFISRTGKKFAYEARFHTKLGTIHVELRPDLAPNHVRSFIALAKCGYYDGLLFERSIHLVAEEDSKETLDYVTGGCPIGTGEENFGSIGYWLKPEFSPKAHHEPGSVGTWHEKDADSGACKFYITLNKAPIMDGNFTVFGKVTKGLDIVRAISNRPLRPEVDFRDQPVDPVTIEKVSIVAKEK